MAEPYIPRTLRARVGAQAQNRCGYCLTREAIVGAPMEIDHIIPTSLGGDTVAENLWLACSHCNEYKGNRITGTDPVTEAVVPLFNPRQQVWREHFAWTRDGEQMVGLTPTGRATVQTLKLNRPLLVEARRLWVSVGWHPPAD